ncbi:hypothetical protein OAU25_02250 [Crocinitomicaceae bacterium]|nr:hypothetical protein [Crocinitomicaceae bacterium]
MKYIVLFILSVMGQEVYTQSSDSLQWSFFHPKKSQWMELGLKGSVQEVLIESGEMPDPFYGTNETKFAWFEEHEWEFKSIVIVSEKQLNHEFNELYFGSIDTYGTVYVNGTKVLTCENAFIPHYVQIKPFLKIGVNEINVVITPPIVYHAEMWKNKRYQLPAPNDVHEIAVAPYTRKPQYQFGWDWSLRLNTVGFNKPAVLYSYDENRIINKSVKILEVNESEATIEFMLKMAVDRPANYSWHGEGLETQSVALNNGELKRRITLKNPKLWWPRGHGEQYLYNQNISLYTTDNQLIEKVRLKYGIRTSELVQEKDKWGTSYYFKINGRRIFSKGGDYIPQDIFPSRVTDQSILTLIEDMAESNFNMIRVWGGGYYPDDVFYETCDRLGLMVWQDFMFACSMYPGDDEFIANVTSEFDYQIPRIAAHPCVIQFNGNNEVKVAWGNWGFQIKYGLFGKSAKEIEDAYNRLFNVLAPQKVGEYTNIPYIHTSPLSNWGKMELYNHGSQHYWGVWHGKDPIEDFGKKIGRFNAEYGFQSFPEYTTLASFSKKKEWDLSSIVMKHHQKSYVGNSMILKHAKKLFGMPKSFEDFVYYSQLTQSTAVSIAVAGHRIDAPRCGGTLYWQINDCWPAPSWASRDYFGNWKALQYRIRDDYEDVAVVEKFNTIEDVDYYLVSDVIDTFDCNIKCTVFDLKGRMVEQKNISNTVHGQQTIQIEPLTKDDRSNKNFHLVFEWKDHLGKEHERSFNCLPKKYKRANSSDVSIRIEGIDEEKKSVELRLVNKSFVRDAWITSNQAGIKFSKNFISLIPGEHRIYVTYSGEIAPTKFEIKWL